METTCKVCMITTIRLQHYQFQWLFQCQQHASSWLLQLSFDWVSSASDEPTLSAILGLGRRGGCFVFQVWTYVHFKWARVNQHLLTLVALGELSLSLSVQLRWCTLHCKFGWRKVKTWRMGQSEPASVTAPVGRSVHRMCCVFHLPLHPALTYILPHSILLPADLWPFFVGQFFLNPDPPYYPPT